MTDKRLEIRIDSDLLDRVDMWAAGQVDVDNRSEAIRKLLEIGLQGISYEDEEVRLSKGEELILRILAERWREDECESESNDFHINRNVLFDAINNGQFWALNQPAVTPWYGQAIKPSMNEVEFVHRVMFMWMRMNETFKDLTDEEKELFSKKTGWQNVRFPGFSLADENKFYELTSFIVRHGINGLDYFANEPDELDLTSCYNADPKNSVAYMKMLQLYEHKTARSPYPKDVQGLIALINVYKDVIASE